MTEPSEAAEGDRKPAAVDLGATHNNNNYDTISPSSSSSAQKTAAAAAVKPALKQQDKKPSAKTSVSNKKAERHLKWDEQAIEEHDLLRGTRMKIDEPNTPYTHYDSGAESDGSSTRPKSPATQRPTICWDNLERRLDSVAAVQHQYPSSPETSEHDDITGTTTTNNANNDGDDHNNNKDDRDREMRKLEFREHRKRHYNEMDMVKKFRQQHADDFDDDDDNDDVNGSKNHNNNNNNHGGLDDAHPHHE